MHDTRAYLNGLSLNLIWFTHHMSAYVIRPRVLNVLMSSLSCKRYTINVIFYTHSARKQKDHVPMVYFDPNLTICLNHTTCRGVHIVQIKTPPHSVYMLTYSHIFIICICGHTHITLLVRLWFLVSFKNDVLIKHAECARKLWVSP